MSDPFGLTVGVLSIVSVVVQAASRAVGMVDKTVTARATQQQVIRNLRHELDKTVKVTTNMQIALSAMVGNSTDKTVKRMSRKCVSFKVAPLTPAGLTSNNQSRMCHCTTAADDGAEGYARIH
jgi:hypothetical protein